MRIVSLLPSATDIVVALGLSPSLVGRTHECDWPGNIKDVPVMTQDALQMSSMSTREINEAIAASVHSGSSIYLLDLEALKEAAPDLILTQELCTVCAVSYSQVAKAARMLDAGTKILSLEPRTLGDILEQVTLVAEVAGVADRGVGLVAELHRRIEAVKESVRFLPRPKVASLEWLDPIYFAGHWVPDQVAAAGATEVVGRSGQYSRPIPWEMVASSKPAFLFLMPCGHSIDRAQKDIDLISGRPGWSEIPAVSGGQVWAVNGPAYFNRPGPRVVRGIEVLASIIHKVGEVGEDEARRLISHPA
ncbi:MAG: cobalamin-binding protein [Actinomycetota bacterium]